MRSDENYAAVFEQARQMAADKAKDEIYRRGIEGFDHPVLYEAKSQRLTKRIQTT